MNVLLIEHDLYKSVGGGQTVYKRLIESYPRVHFYYYGLLEVETATRPSNAHLIRYAEPYRINGLSGEFSDLNLPKWAYPDFVLASNLAASAAKVRIDVIDVPDYKMLGYFLRPAFERHGQKGFKVVLSLHGNLSETQAVNWGGGSLGTDISADQREQFQYRVADERYGISRDYLEHWQAIGGFVGKYISPARLLGGPKILPYERKSGGVALNFIGRTEGAKGPDLFVDLLAWLPTGSYSRARIVGPDATDRSGILSSVRLQAMSSSRGLAVEFKPTASKHEISALFGERSLTVLPSRLDTLNLVALESLLVGCPIAVSEKAGVCRFLRESWPNVPFTALDVDRLYRSAKDVTEVLANYDGHRAKVISAVNQVEFRNQGVELDAVYHGNGGTDTLLCRDAAILYDRMLSFYERHQTPRYRELVTMGVLVCEGLRNREEGYKQRDPRREIDLWSTYREWFYRNEDSAREIDAKVEVGRELIEGSRIDRARVWAELARLERMRGNDFVAATYDLRVLRSLGRDPLGVLPAAEDTLRDHGFAREADAAVAMYGAANQRWSRAAALLEDARQRTSPQLSEDFEWVLDQRRPAVPRVSIIISLFRAASKLEAFLRMLQLSPWVADGTAELVLVDSHSPTDEAGVFRPLQVELGFSAIYIRTRERETIQRAWNRGVQAARAPYLVCLGVDEMLRPEALALLARELDADDKLDWVQGSAVVSDVNEYGTPRSDVMAYIRSPYSPDLVYLDTCYLSWVGAMYRKSVHTRFGLYDDTFGAAGDTEFKGRLLPFIKTKTLPLSLGIFLNYAEERTTESPRAEIEDLRAWYLHRSPAGVAYALQRRDPADAAALFRHAVVHRKSYSGSLSSDLDFAVAIAEFATKAAAGCLSTESVAAVQRVHEAYRSLDWLQVLSPRVAQRERVRVAELAASGAQTVQQELRLPIPPDWQVFNDNRYVQHSSFWRSRPLTTSLKAGARAYWRRLKNLSQAEGKGREILQIDAAEVSPLVSIPPAKGLELLSHQLHARIGALAAEGKNALANDLRLIGQYLMSLADGRPTFDGKGQSAGTHVCRLLLEMRQGKPPVSALELGIVVPCEIMGEIARPICAELADAFDGLVEQARKAAEETRGMEVAARLLTYPVPKEGVKRHRLELSPQVMEMLKRAADSARISGNVQYAERLTTVMVLVQTELVAIRG